MAVGDKSDFVIYHDQIHSGMVEGLVQNTALFNEAGGNSIRLMTRRHRGDYFQETFWKLTPNMIARRITEGTGVVDSVPDIPIGQGEHVAVKLNRRIGPLGQTIDAFKKVQAPADRMALNFLLGTQIAKEMQVEMLNTAIAALVGALGNQALNTKNLIATSPTAGMNTVNLSRGLELLGDAANRVTTFLMHSVPAFQLLRDQLVNFKFDAVSGVSVAQGVSQALGRRMIVTDSPSLVVTGTSPGNVTAYRTLALTENAAAVEESEEDTIHDEIVSGYQSLFVRLQGEFAYNLGLKGFRWNTATGANPTFNAVATGSNWVQEMTSHKDLAGVIIITKSNPLGG